MSRADSTTTCETQIYNLVTSNLPQRRDNYMVDMLQYLKSLHMVTTISSNN